MSRTLPLRRLPHLAAALLLFPLALPVAAQTAPAAQAPAAQAAPAGPLRIGVIDVESILTESSRGQKALAEIEALRKQKQDEGKALQDEITQLRDRLTEGRLSLSDQALADLEKELEAKVIAGRRFNDDATRELTRKRDQVLENLERGVFPIINQLGQEGGYTLIFNKFNSGLVYADEAVDITAQVIARYDAQAPATGE